MEIMGMLAVIVNCTLVGLNGQLTRMWPSLGKLETIIIVVIVEHLLLLLKFAIAFAIPDVPHWVQIEMGKAEFQRREAAKVSRAFSERSLKFFSFSSVSKNGIPSMRQASSGSSSGQLRAPIGVRRKPTFAMRKELENNCKFHIHYSGRLFAD